MKSNRTLYYLLKCLLLSNSECSSVDMRIRVICEDNINIVSRDETDNLKDCILADLKDILLEKEIKP